MRPLDFNRFQYILKNIRTSLINLNKFQYIFGRDAAATPATPPRRPSRIPRAAGVCATTGFAAQPHQPIAITVITIATIHVTMTITITTYYYYETLLIISN